MGIVGSGFKVQGSGFKVQGYSKLIAQSGKLKGKRDNLDKLKVKEVDFWLFPFGTVFNKK